MEKDLIVECSHTSPTPRPVRPRCVGAKSATCVTWLIHISSPRVRHDLFIRPRCVCVTWLIHVCLSRVWHDSFIRPRCVGVCRFHTHSAMWVTWLMYMSHTPTHQISQISHPLYMSHVHESRHPHSRVGVQSAYTHTSVTHSCRVGVKSAKSATCETWLIHTAQMCGCEICYVGDVTHVWVWHNTFICVTRRFHVCDMTHSYVRHDSHHVCFARRYCTTTHNTLQHTYTLQHTATHLPISYLSKVLYCYRLQQHRHCNRLQQHRHCNRLQQHRIGTATTDCNNRLQQQTAPHLPTGDCSQVLHRLILIAGLTNS